MSKSIYTKEYKYVTHQLREARKENAMTQQYVARVLNKPQSYLSKCETGERRLDITELHTFAKLYKKPLTYFVEE